MTAAVTELVRGLEEAARAEREGKEAMQRHCLALMEAHEQAVQAAFAAVGTAHDLELQLAQARRDIERLMARDDRRRKRIRILLQGPDSPAARLDAKVGSLTYQITNSKERKP